jgi:hypothetical protein
VAVEVEQLVTLLAPILFGVQVVQAEAVAVAMRTQTAMALQAQPILAVAVAEDMHLAVMAQQVDQVL